MALLSSKTLIQVHSCYLFILAVYLVVSPRVITDSDIIFIIGEALQIDLDTTLSPQFPFTVCGVLLFSEALFDLIVVRNLPQPNDIIITPQERRIDDISRLPIPSKRKETVSPLLVQLATLYNEVWTLLSGARFCLYFAISLFIYQSKAGGAWGGLDANRIHEILPQDTFRYDEAQLKSGLDQLKNRVVFAYAFMEMMFWIWTLSNVRDERRQVANRLAEEQAAEQEQKSN